MMRQTRLLAAITALAAPLAGCGGDGNSRGDDDGEPPPILARPSKSATVAITGDDRFVAMVNPETGSLSVFDTTTDTKIANVKTGGEPSSVVIGPDNDTAYVANRADGTVVKVSGLTTAPKVSPAIDVGSEPTGVALSPTGKRLFVAEFAEGRVSVIDTDAMKVIASIDEPDHPKALAVTNNGDASDSDELLIAPEFFGEAADAEGTDTSRTGRIRMYQLSDLKPTASITLAPIASGFAPTDATGTATGPAVQTSPNQLASAIVVGQKLYVTTVSASPAPPIKFNVNVQPVLEVVDLQQHQQDTSALGTMNLARLVKEQVPNPATTPGAPARNFLADLVDVGFVGEDVAYALSQGGDTLQRILLDAPGPTLGSSANKQIDLGVVPAGSTAACQTPTGLVIAHAAARAYVNCWITRSLGVVDLASQALVKTVASDAIADGEKDIQAGKRFFFTARGRWSTESWEACGSCHPDGLTDNITWIFNAGPRQTISLDGSFSHAAGRAQQQRVLNWTANFEEIHDFERNTRAVSGGLGAITDPGPSGCGKPDEKPRLLALDGLRSGKSAATLTDVQPAAAKQLQDQPGGCTNNWDQIEAYVKAIRPPRGLRTLDAASVARGAALFAKAGTAGADPNAAGCVDCHGGPGWTASRVFYRASTERTDALGTSPTGDFTAPPAFPNLAAVGAQAWSFQSLQIALQPPSALFDAPEATTAIGPNQIACALRNVSTFGVPGDAAATAALEIKNPDKSRAQGRLGYNVPSLYGLALGAPYLHQGGAHTLAELFDDAKWRAHAEAGSAVWLHQGSADDIAARKRDLVNFLLALDAGTAVQDLPAGFDACPANDP